MSESFLVLTYSLDHFASVFAPFLYPRHSLAFATVTSALAWVFAMTFNSIGIPQVLDFYVYSTSISACTLSMSCSLSCKIYQSVHVASERLLQMNGF